MKGKLCLIVVVALLLFWPASAAAQHSVALTWTAPTTGPAPTGYNVYRYASACPAQITISTATKLTSTPITTLSYTDTSVTAGSSYCYFATSLTASSESSASNAFQVTIPLAIAQSAPNPPTTAGPTVQ